MLTRCSWINSAPPPYWAPGLHECCGWPLGRASAVIAQLFDGRLFHIVHALASRFDSAVVPLLSAAEAARLSALRAAVLTDVLPAGATPTAPSTAGPDLQPAAAPASAPEPGPMLAPTSTAEDATATAAALALNVLQEFCGVDTAVEQAPPQDGIVAQGLPTVKRSADAMAFVYTALPVPKAANKPAAGRGASPTTLPPPPSPPPARSKMLASVKKPPVVAAGAPPGTGAGGEPANAVSAASYVSFLMEISAVERWTLEWEYLPPKANPVHGQPPLQICMCKIGELAVAATGTAISKKKAKTAAAEAAMKAAAAALAGSESLYRQLRKKSKPTPARVKLAELIDTARSARITGHPDGGVALWAGVACCAAVIAVWAWRRR